MCITETLEFVSNDGSNSFVQELSYYNHKKDEVLLNQLEEQLEMALRKDTVQGYEEAAKLKKQIDEIKNPVA